MSFEGVMYCKVVHMFWSFSKKGHNPGYYYIVLTFKKWAFSRSFDLGFLIVCT